MTQAQPDLFHDKVSKAMIAVTLWKHKGEEKVKNDLAKSSLFEDK